MPWFKVDDTFAMHEKVLAAGNAAIGLWCRAGSWSMQQLTDGFVPNHVVRSLGTPKERRQLVENSLWVEAEGGVKFLNWEERQPTKEQVEAARQAAAERQRHARERAKSQRESRRDTSVSHGPPDPTRPDPYKQPLSDESDEAPVPDGFEAFWDAYDKKVGRKKAEQKYRLALRKPGVTAPRLLRAAESYVAGVRAKGKHPEFTKNPETWLNGEHWTDEATNVHQLRNGTDEQGRVFLGPLPSSSPFGPS